MDDTNPRVEPVDQRLRFSSGGVSPFMVLAGLAFLAVAAGTFTSGHTPGEVAVLAFFACILLASSVRRSIVEFDLATRRLSLTREFLNLWSRTIVDRPFNECRALGIIMYNANGRVSCSAYFQLIDSQRHAIPRHKMTYTAATWFVRKLSAATGIPLEETPMVEMTAD
jgi:hypothetical protein